MLFKMRVLYFSKNKEGNAEETARHIARALKTTSDQIPPAYPSESEKLLFIGVDSDSGKPDKTIMDFCANLSPNRAKNVAFFAINKHGSGDILASLKEAVQKKGVDVVGDPLLIKAPGLLKQGRMKDSDFKTVEDWANKIVAIVAEK